MVLNALVYISVVVIGMGIAVFYTGNSLWGLLSTPVAILVAQRLAPHPRRLVR